MCELCVISIEEMELNEFYQIFFRSSDAVASSMYDDTIRSGKNQNDQNGHLELHPMPKIGESFEATVTTALNPSLFYVSLKPKNIFYWMKWTKLFIIFVFRFASAPMIQHTIK